MSFKELFENVDLKDYAPMPFWSWNNELDKDELIKQIRNMHDAGMGGFVMHARTGLTTPYLGEKWFDCIEACLDEAKRLSMNGWIYDENGWPSGFVGGELLKEKENLATYLEMKTGGFDGDAYAVFIREKGGFKRVLQQTDSEEYYNVYLRYSPANTDILNPKVVTKFINMTYEKYYERFAERFGCELTGFFTDEPQYFRYSTPFSVAVIDYFKEKYDEDVKDGLIHLFFNTQEDYPFRVRYYAALNELYTLNYYKRLYDWCTEHNCKFTGHSIEETTLYMQMWGCAGCMPSYEYEHIPGIDNLAKTNTAKLSARQVGSVAAQLGKKQVLTETFGCAGYDTTPRTLRAVAEKQYVHGVNLMCHHLYSYSLAGQGKADHPPCFSKHITWGEDFKYFNKYFTRLGYMLAESKNTVNAAALSPMTSIYLQYDRFNEKEAINIDLKLNDFQSKVAKENIEYHFLDEKLLAKYGRVEGKTLVLGNCRYEYLMLPYAPNVYASTEKLLKEFVSAGGRIYVYETAPEYVDGLKKDLSYIKSNVTLNEIKQNGCVVLNGDAVDYTHRNLNGTEFIYMVNDGDAPADVKFCKEYLAADILSGEVTDVNGEITLQPKTSAMLIKGQAPTAKAPYFAKESDITANFNFVSATENNLIADFISISRDGVNFEKPRYVFEVFDTLVKQSYNGKLWVKYAFEVQDICPVTLLTERNKGYNFTVNGNAVSFEKSGFDVNFVQADITDYLKTGINEYAYEIDYYQAPVVRYALFDPEATESVRNCLNFDTEIEQIYLRGDFSGVNRKICAKKNTLGLSDIEKNGMPYFAGEVTFAGKFNGKAGVGRIELDGDYMSAKISVNGKEYRATLQPYADVETIDGENTVELKFTASLRNMMGPFHANFDENAVSPQHFRLLGCYDGNGAFSEDYHIKPFGIRKITLKY